ncbi:hypothetical protein [Halostella salina]|uniref:hypothetical protein n=1 Tax=Halostella salina TaxID=1547897 RepID=UPI000EF80B41|nr:hypothetical protein [Halostella salina]
MSGSPPTTDTTVDGERTAAATGRRRFLAAAGSATVASVSGCFGLWSDDADAPSYDADALRSVAALPTPKLPETLPVSPTPTYREEVRERVAALLEPIPEPLAAEDVPNEAVRTRIAEERDRARSALDDSVDAATPLSALGSLRYARHSAADASAVYAAGRDELTLAAVLDRREAVRSELDDLRDRLTYEGGDPVAALATFATVEQHVARAADMLDRADETHESGVFAVGDAAGTVEWARARVSDAAHLHGRYVATVDEPMEWRDRFVEVGRALAADARARFGDVSSGYAEDPDGEFDRDIADAPAEDVVRDAYLAADSVATTVPDPADRPAFAAFAGAAADRDLRAFERVRSSIADGAYQRPESVAAVRTAKLDAVEAVERARADDPLTRRLLRPAAIDLRGGDQYLVRFGDVNDNPADVANAFAEYAYAAARAEAAPGAAARLRGLLRGASDDPDH